MEESESALTKKQLGRPSSGFSELLKIASCIGFDVPDPDALWEEVLHSDDETTDHRTSLQLMKRLNQLSIQCVRAREELERRKIREASYNLLDAERMRAKSNQIVSALESLKTLLQHKDRLSAHVQEQLSENYIPVEISSQADFSKAVQAAAADSSSLIAALEVLRWGFDFKAQASIEEAMKPSPSHTSAILLRYHKHLVSLDKVVAEVADRILVSSRQPPHPSDRVENGSKEFAMEEPTTPQSRASISFTNTYQSPEANGGVVLTPLSLNRIPASPSEASNNFGRLSFGKNSPSQPSQCPNGRNLQRIHDGTPSVASSNSPLHQR